MSAKQHVPYRKGLDEWSLREQRSREYHEASKTKPRSDVIIAVEALGLNVKVRWTLRTGVLIVRFISDI